MSMETLPDKPSELILLALGDLEKCEKDDKYAIDMSNWCCPDWKDPNICCVCFAGAVMVQTLGIKIESGSYERFPWETDFESKLLALDNFRSGHVNRGLQGMGLKPILGLDVRHGVQYKDDPVKFKAAMRDLAAQLAQHGY